MVKSSATNQDLPFLEEVLLPDEIIKDKINLVIAPCGSGKTTAAMNVLTKLASERQRVLYLIDTSAGKSALCRREGMQKGTKEWTEDVCCEFWGEMHGGNGVRVMTYHMCGILFNKNPNWLDAVDVIICDEIHNLIKYIEISRGNDEIDYCKQVYNKLITVKGPVIVFMTATPLKIQKQMVNDRVNYKKLDYRGKVFEYKTNQTIYYRKLEELMESLDIEKKALIYHRNVKNLQKFLEYDGWDEWLALWSIWNTGDREMNKRQKDERYYLLKNEKLPERVKWLFINSAYETAINIRDEDLQTIVIHDSNQDTITQVRGRIRHNIDTLYLYDSKMEHLKDYIPTKYYGIKLFPEDQKELIKELQLKTDGSVIGTNKLQSLLNNQGCIKEKDRYKNKHYIML